MEHSRLRSIPRGVDPQQLHSRDEIYFVASGTGEYVWWRERRRSSVLPTCSLPPLVLVHRFENFSDDLVVWVIFYGPEGEKMAERE